MRPPFAVRTVAASLAILVFPALGSQAQVLGSRAVLLSATLGQYGGMGGFAGGEDSNVPIDWSRRAPMTLEAAKTWASLQKKVAFNFPNETPFRDVLNHIRQEIKPTDKEKDWPALQFFVSPVGLQEAEKTFDSPVQLVVEQVPLADSLQLILDQLDLTYFVQKNGLVRITGRSTGSLQEEIKKSVAPVTAAQARTWIKLFQPVSMPFANPTPLGDVIKYLKTATTGPEMADGLPMYLSPTGLQEADKTEQSPVQLNLEGMPIASTLKLLLEQLGLVFSIDDHGLVVISNVEPAVEEPVVIGGNVGEKFRMLDAEIADLKAQLQAKGQNAEAPKTPAAPAAPAPMSGGFR